MSARFTLDDTKATAWLDRATAKWVADYETGETFPAQEGDEYLPEIGPDYTPRTDDETGIDTYNVVSCAVYAKIITGPGTVDFEFTSDSDGAGYTWLIRLPVPESHDLNLSSGYEELRHCGDPDARGTAAALVVLREAVAAANSCLDALDAYTASQATA